MRHPRLGLSLAALAVAGTLAACSDTGTTPQSRQDDPLVQALNRIAGGNGQVLSVTSKDEVRAGVPQGQVAGPAMLQGCTIDGGCEPIDRTCYSACSWFDVNAFITTGDGGSSKIAILTGSLYANSATAFGDVYVAFYSAGGCVSNPSQFDYASLSGSNGPFTLTSSRQIEYTGGTFTWAVYTDGYAQNRYGRDGYESLYDSTCF